MTVTLTYEPTPLNRVKIEANGFDVGATHARVERSTNQVTWETVRCGTAAPLVTGTVTVYDYEFAPDVVNHYRVIAPNTPTFINAGAAAHAVNASVAPALPAGLQAGDLLLVLAAIRNSGAGTVNQPTGYTTIIDGSNVKLFGKLAGAGEVAPTVSFTGGVAGADTSAQTAAFRDVQLSTVGAIAVLNASAQDIIAPALTFTETVTEGVRVWIGWKQDDWTSVAPVNNGTEIGEPDTTTGDDQGIVWNYWIITTTTPFASSSQRVFTVTGGAAAISRGGTTQFKPTDQVQSASLTPTLDRVWLKVVSSPFLNRALDCVLDGEVTRSPRHGLFEVINRDHPVAVTDRRGSREQVLRVTTRTHGEHEDLDFVLRLGEPVFVHAPAASEVRTQHAVIGETREVRPVRNVLRDGVDAACERDYRSFTLPLREVAAPGVAVCGSTITWQGVLNTYATWADLLAVETSWFDLLQNVGQPSDVIVP